MHRINLRTVDLNLLVVFDAVLAERSVTRASERLHLTQSAVSHALSRLRTLFKDPLFVRAPTGLEPTPRASRLGARIAGVLSEIGAILLPGENFDPATSSRHFNLGMSDYAAFVFMPALTARLKARAPSIRLVVRHTSHIRGLAMLDSGEAELIVGNFPKPPTRVARQLLFSEGFLCAARGNHPAFRQKLTLRAYLSLEHLHVSLSGEPSGYVDDVLRRKKHNRTIALTVGHFLVAPSIVAATDLVATEPAHILRPAARQLGLDIQPPPMTLPEFDVVQMWPRRLNMDEGNAWLRGEVAESLVSQRKG